MENKNIKMPVMEDMDKRREAISKARAILKKNGYTVRSVDLDKIIRLIQR